MPVIVFASPKGGVGKSTSALVLATETARRGAAVTLIDADPNHPLLRWSKRPGKPENVRVIADANEDSIIDVIEEAATTTPFVIVDLEGTASRMVAYALSRADLVIIPAQGSEVDGIEAFKAVKLIQTQERAFKRKIPFAVLFTRVSAAITTRDLKDIHNQLTKVNVPILRSQMVERAAFRALFSFGGTLEELDAAQVSNIPAALDNAHGFTAEVLTMLKQTLKEGRAA